MERIRSHLPEIIWLEFLDLLSNWNHVLGVSQRTYSLANLTAESACSGGAQVCNAGYQGFLCGQCQTDHYKLGRACYGSNGLIFANLLSDCGANPKAAMTIYFLVIIGIFFIFYIFAPAFPLLGTVLLLVNYLQCMLTPYHLNPLQWSDCYINTLSIGPVLWTDYFWSYQDFSWISNWEDPRYIYTRSP